MIDFLLLSISGKHPGFVRVLYSAHRVSMSLSKRVCCCGGSFLLSVSVVFGVSTVFPSRFVRFCSQSKLDGLFVGLASPLSECVSSDCTDLQEEEEMLRRTRLQVDDF